MHYGTSQTVATPSDETSVPIFDEQPGVTLSDLFHRTGLGIKMRFLLALTLIAILPSILLVLVLGDPTGSEQQATLGAVLFTQAQVQAQALNQVISERQARVTSLAQSGTAEQVTTLEAAQASDTASLAWLVVNSNGVIFAAGDHQQTLVKRTLATSKLVSSPSALLPFIQSAATATTMASQIPALGANTGSKQVWIAFAAPLPVGQGKVLLALFALPKVLNNLIAPPGSLKGSTGVLLDQDEQVAASAGTLAMGEPLLATAPISVAGIRSNLTTLTTIADDPLTGRTDLALGSSVPALGGMYVVLVDQNTTLISSNRYLFTGRNAPLLLLGVFVMVVLVATWIALPIIRPIRRATRVIETTTEDVRKLAHDAKIIAEDHMTGTTILTGASKRLSGRRQVLIRDTTLIARICQEALPRLQIVHYKLQETRDAQAFEELSTLYQSFQQIHSTAAAIASELGKDTSLDQLDQAMTGAREIAKQFEAAGKQLEVETAHLEMAARSLI